ncbi:MAG TPA: DUF1848 domain-containing protein [Firmicutes bacterium]|nr:DUF1848 domain-containing protein [Bacillota bacterium]
MIISVSRRTDIPAFYAEWFVRRLRQGFAYVRNPMNFRQVSKVILDPKAVDCFVFWTKNPRPLLPYLQEIQDRGYPFYFQFTLTPYDGLIEKRLPPKEKLLETFQALSQAVGAARVIWRYDPIFLSRKITLEDHFQSFTSLAQSLAGFTERCVISFFDVYRKIKRRAEKSGLRAPKKAEMIILGRELAAVASQNGLEMFTCAEGIDLTRFGIRKGKCIDDALIEKISGISLTVKKDPNQRPHCGCVQSVDLGAYNTCLHNCLYCYANGSEQAVQRNTAMYSAKEPILCSRVSEEDQITTRKVR